MPRRLKLSPLQRDILMMLEEAGAETVGTVIATLKPSDQSEFTAQVDELVRLGLIGKEENNLVLTAQGRIALRT
jgi:predicted transcriptional regulator